MLPVLLVLAATPASRPYELVLGADVPVTLALAATLVVPEIFASRFVRKSCPCDLGVVDAFDAAAARPYSHAVALVSDVSIVSVLVLAAGLDALHVGLTSAPWIGFAEDLLVMTEAVLAAAAATELVKIAVPRPRPLLYRAEPGSPFFAATDNYMSFFSMHAAIAFAAATSFAITTWLRRPGSWQSALAIVGGAALAATISVERVLAGKHFPSDVIVGAMVGAGISAGVTLLHRRPLPVNVGVSGLSGGALLSVTGAL